MFIYTCVWCAQNQYGSYSPTVLLPQLILNSGWIFIFCNSDTISLSPKLCFCILQQVFFIINDLYSCLDVTVA